MTIRLRGRVHGGRLELDQPVNLPDGQFVEVVIQSPAADEAEDWRVTGMARLEEEWDNPKDAIYDNWRTLYGV
jgi:hypothetical protein